MKSSGICARLRSVGYGVYEIYEAGEPCNCGSRLVIRVGRFYLCYSCMKIRWEDSS